ncbi:MAG: hypothetical protein ACPGXK_11155 [Phycisphaerae bacterium]
MALQSTLPAAYFVPRRGRLALVTVHCDEELRSLRTELALLACIRDHLVAGQPGRRGRKHDRDLPTRGELAWVRIDAMSEIVDEAIGYIDEDFSEVRKEILMSAIEREAEQLANEIMSGEAEVVEESTAEQGDVDGSAVESDLGQALDDVTAGLDEAASILKEMESATDVESALPEAEGEPLTELGNDGFSEPEPTDVSASDDMPATDEMVASPEMPSSPDEGLSDSEVTPDLEMPAQGTSDADAEASFDQPSVPEVDEVVDHALSDQADAEDQVAECDAHEDEPCSEGVESTVTDECPDAMPVESAEACETEAIVGSVSVGEEESVHVSAGSAPDTFSGDAPDAVMADLTPASSCAGDGVSEAVSGESSSPVDTPMEATAAISQIEEGIRTLSRVLSQEVTDQWTRARRTLQDAEQNRDAMREAREASDEMLKEIQHIRLEIDVVKSEAELARREAKLFREEAARAKERSEASAKQAEVDADQVARERESVCRQAAAAS